MPKYSVGVVGTIVDKERKSGVQWIISRDQLCRACKNNVHLQSPPFHSLRSSWYLKFYPNDRSSGKCLVVYLVRDDITNKEFPLTLRIRFRICHNQYKFKEDSEDYTFYQDYQMCRMLWDDASSSDNPRFLKSRRVDTLDTKIECFVSQEHPQTMDESSFCSPEFSDDFKNLCMSRRRSDISIKVKGVTFPVHKLILKARSSVFDDIFTHTMKENKDILNFTGYDVRSVHNFLIFLYTGKLKSCASYPDAECLYQMAHQYKVEDLKIRCRQLIEQKMCEDTVCDVFNLAGLYDDSQLLESAKRFVKRNVFRVFPSKQWLDFHLQNKSLAIKIQDEIFSSENE